jgi:hypothetical protein
MHDDDDDVAKNQTGNSVVGRVDYVKRERRLARQFIDIYPSQFQRRLNNDFQSRARERRTKTRDAKRASLWPRQRDGGQKPARLLVVSRSGWWARGLGAPVPHASRYLLTYFLDSTVSKWRNVLSDDRRVVVVVVVGLYERHFKSVVVQ